MVVEGENLFGLLDSGVAVVPGSGFGMQGCLRLSYATSEDRLELAATRLASALRRLGD
ncbi:aminotransferase class I/II-fold pyridoxal phosphate-dependent enzyme [Ralstonia pseudosolanacearum]|uniref:Putative aspartate aminotransferase protein n=1 Tax=Ralstonia solanacearum TaxID=305 RepID=A0A0S4TRQ3_RALSL|nr:aminotransferase class I/II-fold pyridoxal phosphate-dependent enzyme [Ralstonia pseudosolanacearum]CUV12738.1 putative aspartate aminotransferase protein [Ralstonia solanacearum]